MSLLEGEVRAVVRRGDALACLVVTLQARPIESYLRVMGTNGSVEADFVIGYVVRLLGPGASAPAVVLKPFSKAWQTGWGSLKGLLGLIFRRHKSYPGLAELLGRFYASIVRWHPASDDRCRDHRDRAALRSDQREAACRRTGGGATEPRRNCSVRKLPWRADPCPAARSS